MRHFTAYRGTMFDTINIIGLVLVGLTVGGGGYALGRWIGARMSYAGKAGKPLFDRRAART